MFYPTSIAAFLAAAAACNHAAAFAPASRSARPSTRVNIATRLPNVSDLLTNLGGGNNQGPNKNEQKEPERPSALIDLDGIAFSGLNGKALSLTTADFPDSGTVRKVIPADCFEPETAKSLEYLTVSLVGTTACTAFGVNALQYLDPSFLAVAATASLIGHMSLGKFATVMTFSTAFSTLKVSPTSHGYSSMEFFGLCLPLMMLLSS